MPDHLLEALLKARCPKDCKELLLSLIRLSGTYQTTHREVSFASMSRYMNTERYKVMDCLDELLKFKMVRKTKDPRFPKAMCLVVNSNYNEWTCLKLLQDESNCLSAKHKTSSPEAKSSSEAKSPKTGHHGSRKRSNKNSKIRKNYHSHVTSSFSAGKEQINKNPEILKFYHSLQPCLPAESRRLNVEPVFPSDFGHRSPGKNRTKIQNPEILRICHSPPRLERPTFSTENEQKLPGLCCVVMDA